MKTQAANGRLVVIGHITGIYGIKGWVRIFSYTSPRENILAYSPWLIYIADEWRSVAVLEGRRQGAGIVAHLEGYDDREHARTLIDTDIAVSRGQFPEPAEGEYYWADLAGLKVVTVNGIELGKVDHLMSTGANDVLVVKGDRDRLIPFIHGKVVTGIDTQSRIITVDWDPDF